METCEEDPPWRWWCCSLWLNLLENLLEAWQRGGIFASRKEHSGIKTCSRLGQIWFPTMYCFCSSIQFSKYSLTIYSQMGPQAFFQKLNWFILFSSQVRLKPHPSPYQVPLSLIHFQKLAVFAWFLLFYSQCYPKRSSIWDKHEPEYEWNGTLPL